MTLEYMLPIGMHMLWIGLLSAMIAKGILGLFAWAKLSQRASNTVAAVVTFTVAMIVAMLS